MLNDLRLSNLPGYGKLFVAIFTTLMLLVVFWAMFIFYITKGVVDEDTRLPAYLTHDTSGVEQSADLDRQETAEQLSEDSSAVLAPVWDSNFVGEEIHVDSATNIQQFRVRDSEMAAGTEEVRTYGQDEKPDFEENVGLAHTHVNGQTLLFFAIGFVFLFTSSSAKVKKIVYWVFGTAILLHTIGLTGQGYHWLFDDMLAASGVALLVVIVYMALLIYVELARTGDIKNP